MLKPKSQKSVKEKFSGALNLEPKLDLMIMELCLSLKTLTYAGKFRAQTWSEDPRVVHKTPKPCRSGNKTCSVFQTSSTPYFLGKFVLLILASKSFPWRFFGFGA